MSRFPQAGLAGAGPGLRGFWHWWLGALASWLPLRLRAAFGLAQQRLLLRHEAGEIRLSLHSPGLHDGEEDRELARLPLESMQTDAADPLARILSSRVNTMPRWLTLPARQGLRRRMTLPAAASERLRDVLAFEIDRQTPFTVEDVHYDARLIARRGDGQIDAELVVVPKADLEAALATLGGPVRATLAGVDMIDADGKPLGVNLLPTAQRRRQRDPQAMWNLVLVAVAIAALGGGLWQIKANRTAAADAFETEAKRRGAQARKVSDERRQFVDLVEGLRFLQETRAGRPTTVEVLDELSRRLPDNTYLEKVSIEGDKLLVMGLSSEAPNLVSRLQGSKLWHSMTLTGALQPDPSKGKDRFTLTADLSIAKSDTGKRGRKGDAR